MALKLCMAGRVVSKDTLKGVSDSDQGQASLAHAHEAEHASATEAVLLGEQLAAVKPVAVLVAIHAEVTPNPRLIIATPAMRVSVFPT